MPLRKLPQLPLPCAQYQYPYVSGNTGGILAERSLESRLCRRLDALKCVSGLGVDISVARVKSMTQTITMPATQPFAQKNKYDLEQMD